MGISAVFEGVTRAGTHCWGDWGAFFTNGGGFFFLPTTHPGAGGGGALFVVKERGFPGVVPAVVVPDSRAALAALAHAVFGEPSAQMSVYGVTGTNGKTTTSYALYSILATAYTPEKCGLMTTAEVFFGDERRIPAR